MEVIGHHRKAKHFNSHDARKEFETISNPLSSILEVLTGVWIIATEKPASNTSIHAMNDVDFIVRAKLLSLNSRHVGPSVRNGPLQENRIEWPDEQHELKNLQPKAGLFTKRHSYKWVAPEVPPLGELNPLSV